VVETIHNHQLFVVAVITKRDLFENRSNLTIVLSRVHSAVPLAHIRNSSPASELLFSIAPTQTKTVSRKLATMTAKFTVKEIAL
jgi:hypothetical protein